MTRRLFAALIVLGTVWPVAPRGFIEPATSTAAVTPANGQRHHYRMSARIRPLLLFWIGSDDVGDAVIAKRRQADGAGYSLLIGSDPDRAPRRINRWGYIDEEIRGDGATLIGLMTESDEASVEQAESNIQKRDGERTFNIIRGSVVGGEARSVVTSVAAPSDYTLRHVDTLLDLAQRESSAGKTRVVQLPPGTRPGFLVALADLVHAQVIEWGTLHRLDQGEANSYVYHGHIFQLKVTRSLFVASARVGSTTYDHLITSAFQVREMNSGELTDFSMTYAADGPLAETPLAASYQPRWWLQVQLTLDDSRPGPPLARELNP